MSPTMGRFLFGASVAFNLAVVAAHVVWSEAVGPGAAADGRTRCAEPGAGPLSSHLADRLGLDEARRAHLDRLRAPVLEERSAYADEAAALRRTMIAAVVSGDAPAAEAARLRLVERQVRFQQSVVQYLAAVGATLDAPRRGMLAEYLEGALFPGLGGHGHPGAAACAPTGAP